MTTSAVTSEHRTLAQTVAAAFHVSNERFSGYEEVRERVTVPRYWDEREVSSIGLVHARDSPTPGLFSYGTIGVSDVPLLNPEGETAVRAEFVAAAPADLDWYPKLVATAAFCVINGGWSCWPGVIMPELVDLYDPDVSMRHLLLTTPYLWDRTDEDEEVRQQPPTIPLVATTVAWLQLVPIAHSEACYAEAHGIEELETQLERGDVDVCDLDRAPVVDYA